MVFWPCLLTTKLSCLQKNKWGPANWQVWMSEWIGWIGSCHFSKIANGGYFKHWIQCKQRQQITECSILIAVAKHSTNHSKSVQQPSPNTRQITANVLNNRHQTIDKSQQKCAITVAKHSTNAKVVNNCRKTLNKSLQKCWITVVKHSLNHSKSVQ